MSSRVNFVYVSDNFFDYVGGVPFKQILITTQNNLGDMFCISAWQFRRRFNKALLSNTKYFHTFYL